MGVRSGDREWGEEYVGCGCEEWGWRVGCGVESRVWEWGVGWRVHGDRE